MKENNNMVEALYITVDGVRKGPFLRMDDKVKALYRLKGIKVEQVFVPRPPKKPKPKKNKADQLSMLPDMNFIPVLKR